MKGMKISVYKNLPRRILFPEIETFSDSNGKKIINCFLNWDKYDSKFPDERI